MKKIKILTLLALGLAVTACDPVKDDATLSNSFNPEAVKLEVQATKPGGNNLTIKMATPGVCGYWDYVIDKKFTNEVQVIFPFTGKHTFTYSITTPYMERDGDPTSAKFVSKTIEVNVTELTDSLPKIYYKLVGDKLQGKSWVFDKSVPVWWAMVNPSNWKEVWWNPEGAQILDVDAVMTFDLAGGANYTYKSSPSATAVTGGKFKFNGDFTKLTVAGPASLAGVHADSEKDKGTTEYDIRELTNDKMVLTVSSLPSRGTGWIWVFKPAQ